MKNAIILYQNDENQEVIDFLKKSFEEVFDQYITFTNAFLNRLDSRAALAADAYLVCILSHVTILQPRYSIFTTI